MKAGLLGGVHRRLRALHQAIGGGAVGGRHGGPDAAGEEDLAVVHLDRTLDAAQEVSRQTGDRADAVEVGDRRDELIAALPRDEPRLRPGLAVGAQRQGLAQSTGHDLEDLVADLVPQAVVDLPEAVEIDDQHRHQVVSGGLHEASQQLPEAQAVGQAGQ